MPVHTHQQSALSQKANETLRSHRSVLQEKIDRLQNLIRTVHMTVMHLSAEPDFILFFQKLHPDLPDYLAAAIAQYVEDREYAEIEQMLAEEEAGQNR